jgi:hypothetical protein
MLQLIRHRVNGLTDLLNLEPRLGAEIDLRSRGSEIVLQHDAFKHGISLVRFLEVWVTRPRGILILNVKEDGLESTAESLMAQYQIPESNFFFLDCALPTLVRRTLGRTARPYGVRYSEYENLDSALRLSGRAQWAWLDSFSGELPPLGDVEKLSQAFDVCLVSPELQGYPLESIYKFSELLPFLSAVCTKHPDLWKSINHAKTSSHPTLLQRVAESI